ncbi:hypothetical protein GVN21_16745 [Caulobacter sp. SLTY]|uniref:hypothetical protein n=1 Tax=Caulobacter sp. SLTY TaxID=2683262 RepID=UPI001412AF85|nr:hypothetical protein [Caulobacter sp. SLTY]NBB17016.1 hypothetical protein [Caulobacter sp. SLTY]
MARAIPKEHPAFAAFWAAYPTRPWNPRTAASAVFARLVKAGVDPEALVGAAGVFAASCRQRGIEDKFIPYASTWLNKRQDLDFPASPPSAASPEGPAAPGPACDPALAFLQLRMSDADFAIWIAPLRVQGPPDGRPCITVIARTTTALDRVRRDWGRLITAQLGPVAWTVERNQP